MDKYDKAIEWLTDRARKVMQSANREARRFNHEWIGTEHVLLGLIRERSGVAGAALENLGVKRKKVRREIEKIVQPGTGLITMGKLPQTSAVKKLVELAREEARDLNHNYVGTEDLLLGLLRLSESVAGVVLVSLGFKLEDIRKEVLMLLEKYETAEEPSAEPESDLISMKSLEYRDQLLELFRGHLRRLALNRAAACNRSVVRKCDVKACAEDAFKATIEEMDLDSKPGVE